MVHNWYYVIFIIETLDEAAIKWDQSLSLFIIDYSTLYLNLAYHI